MWKAREMRLGGPAFLIAAVVGCGGWLGGCSWTFDDEAPDFPLVGSPPVLSTLQKINNGPVYGSAIVRGVDNGYWIALQEESKKLRLVRLTEPSRESTIEGDQFTIAWRAFFVWKSGEPPADPVMPRPATLSVVSAGQDPSEAQIFEFRYGVGNLILGGVDDVFAYVPPKGTTDKYELVRRTGGMRRDIPIPGGDTAPSLSGAMFSGDAEYFFDRQPCAICDTEPDDADRGGFERRQVVAHSTRAEVDLDLGLLPRRIWLYEPSASRRQFITCGNDGLRIVPVVESEQNPRRVLDETPCATDVFALQRIPIPSAPEAQRPGYTGQSRTEVFYAIGNELRRVPVDGSAPPRRALDREIERVLAIYDPSFIVYSQDPADRYIYGVGDAWIGDWRFMNRGRAIDLSSDKKRVRFLENAARSGGIGDLNAADIGGPVERLARNVYQYDEIEEGRVLAAANHSFRGIQNRIVILDERRRHAQWVVDQASRYSFIPGSSDLLVDIVTGASSSDMVRVPLPAPLED
jgi:hypothetical protein